jgi:seryl-tRNA synthetase
MLDMKFVRTNIEKIRNCLINRNSSTLILDELVALDEKRRDILKKVEDIRSLKNTNSKAVARLKAQGDEEALRQNIENGKILNQQSEELEAQLKQIDEQYMQRLLYIPNVYDEDTPIGKDETFNPEIRRIGIPRKFDFEPKPHWEIGSELNGLDFDRGSKLSGSRFTIMKGDFARLERSLGAFMMDLHSTEHGYTEVMPPHMVLRETITATGQLPKFEEDLYNTKGDDLFLIPTSEVALVGMHRDEILELKDLPAKYCGYSPCYRREAGSYGKDVRGVIRQHQFDKVELVWHTTPERSAEDLETLTSHAEKVLKLLELPYRVIRLCSGDLGFGASRTYDIEVWLPSYNSYKEISSCSNDCDFQARRGNIRFRDKDNKLKYVHTLNGSGLAIGRTLVAIVENYQTSDGKIKVPDVLIPYMKKEYIG